MTGKLSRKALKENELEFNRQMGILLQNTRSEYKEYLEKNRKEIDERLKKSEDPAYQNLVFEHSREDFYRISGLSDKMIKFAYLSECAGISKKRFFNVYVQAFDQGLRDMELPKFWNYITEK